MLYTILVGIQVVVALTLVGIILIQHGKGADAGAAFGSGASGTVFGAKGSANFLTRATAALATVFFAISLTLAYLVNGATSPTGASVTDQVQQRTPDSSILSDDNNNGVPGDQALQPGAPKNDAAGDGQPAGDDAGGAASQSGAEQQPGGGGDTSAQVPE